MAAAAPIDRDDGEVQPASGWYVLFTLAARRFALPLEVVERSVRIVDITPLPELPGIVLGVIDVAGRIVPVVNVRKRFGIPERGIAASDLLLIARASAQMSARTLALWVDAVDGVVRGAEHDAPAMAPGHETECVSGVLRLPDGLVLIHDLGRFLSLTEDRVLDLALAEVAGTGNGRT
jgi:purine-binding chemotaxis protein CheW